MRHVIIAAAALAISGAFAAAKAEPIFEPGGPVKVGNSCKVMTQVGGNEAGYYGPCPKEAKKVAKRGKKSKSS
jgi:hypothetical protein